MKKADFNQKSVFTYNIIVNKRAKRGEFMDVIEIFLSIIAVFGGYCILDMIRLRLLHPLKDRKKLSAAVFFDDAESLARVCDYARYLRRENKISGERLIILINDDIIKCKEDLSELCHFGRVFKYTECKEFCKNEGICGQREKSCDYRGDC